MKSGVYQIKNLTNNKVYIGSSKNLDKRSKAHFYLLENNKHHSIHFQNAYNQEIDKSVFKFEILEELECYDDDFLKEREQFYMNLIIDAENCINGNCKKFIDLSYNIKPFSNKGFFGTHSEKTRDLLSYANKNQKPVYVYDKMGYFIGFYRNASIVSKTVNSSKNCILDNCKTKRFILKEGYLVCFEEDLKELETLINSSEKPIEYKVWNKGKNVGREAVGLNKNRLIPVKVTDTVTGIETLYETYKDFAIEIKASISTMCKFLKKGYKNTDLYNKRYLIIKI